MIRSIFVLKTPGPSAAWWLCMLLVSFSITASGCDDRESKARLLERERLMAIGQLPADHKPGDLVSMGIGLLNYTDEEINEVYVDGTWAANVTKHTSVTGTGSAYTPAFYDPSYKIKVRWRNESLFKIDEKSLFEKEVVPEPPQKDSIGRMTWLWIAFFPDGSVKIYPAWVSAGHPDFPDGLQDPKEECLKARPDGTVSCYGSSAPSLFAEGGG